MNHRISLTLAASLIAAGCTSQLAVSRYDPNAPAVGYPYRLKFTQFETAVTWRVLSCDSAAGTSQAIKLKITAEVKDKSGLDADHYYVIDPRSLQGTFRNTDFSMEYYADRGLKSINSTVDDQTGTAIVNVLTGVGKLATASLLPAGPGDHAPVVCSEKVVKALQAINGTPAAGKKKAVKGQEAVVGEAKAAVEKQTLLVTQLTADVAAGGPAGKIAEARLRREELQLASLNAVLTAEQKALKALVDVVSDTRTVLWPERGSEFERREPITPSAAALTRWNMSSTDNRVKVFLRLVPVAALYVPADEAGSGGRERRRRAAVSGLPYREPQLMRLEICSGAPCSGTREELAEAGNLVKDVEALVLQAGPLLYLPFQARTFANMKSSAGFSEAGALTTAGASVTRSAGVGASEAVKGGAEQVASFVDTLQAADVKRLQARTDELKAEKALKDAEDALKAPTDADKKAAIAAFQTDATLAGAERAKIEAEQALEAARRLVGQ
jgi:hypothetical protein